jgi:transposase-like protein
MKTLNLFSDHKQRLSLSEQDFFKNQTLSENNTSPFDFLIHSLQNINGIKCPNCGSDKVMKNGSMKNKTPRFICRSCHKNYSLYTNTFLQNVKKKKILFDYIPLRMDDGGTLRICSELLGISLNTSFEWNKKIFGSIELVIPHELEGIIELVVVQDKISRKGEKPEGYFGFKPPNPNTDPKKKYKKAPKLKKGEDISEKVQIAVTFSRKGQLDMKVIQLGDLDKEELKRNLYSKIKKGKKMLISDNPTLKMFFQEKKLSYHICEVKQNEKSRNKYFDNDTAIRIYQMFYGWLERFNGVATKYLQNYLKWFMNKLYYRNFDLYAYHLALDGLQNKKGKRGYRESVMFIN